MRDPLLDKNTPEYELARAMWMAKYDATFKSFDRVPVGLRKINVEIAQSIIKHLEKSSYVVIHESSVDGG